VLKGDRIRVVFISLHIIIARFALRSPRKCVAYRAVSHVRASWSVDQKRCGGVIFLEGDPVKPSRL